MVMGGATQPWTTHRGRAQALRDRHPFAAEVLGLYLALLDAQEDIWDAVRADPPPPARLAAWSVKHAVPRVLKATEMAGPEALAEATRDLVEAGGAKAALAGWLTGRELPPVERYLARACMWAPLMALGDDAGAACAADPSPRGDRRCPRCGGAPQLSVRSQVDDRLVSGRRQLACERCGHAWSFSASACASCGETTGSKRTVYAEQREGPVVGRDDAGAESPSNMPRGRAPVFPHLRVDACATCERYVIDVDLGRDPQAVPEVDELAALPLAVYAADQGLTKITPNLVGL
jgi:Protein involved in formate dehydrogenase formation